MRRSRRGSWRSGALFGLVGHVGSIFGTKLNQRIVLLSVFTGAATGLIAVLFYVGLDFMTSLNMKFLAGREVPHPMGEPSLFSFQGGIPRWWVFFLLPIAGGLVSGLLVFLFAPEAEGHGTDAVLDAFHNKRGRIRRRIPLIKGLASIVTLSSGGSAGKEGPIAQIGAGIGSWISELFRLTPKERRILLLTGVSGGVGAIFRAPLGGAMFATEVLYAEDFETDAVIPCVFSSVTAFSVLAMFLGTTPIFLIPAVEFTNWKALLYYILLALVCSGTGALYVRVFYGMRDRVFRRITLPNYLKPALGGLGVALVGLFLPQTLGGGYGYLQQAIMGAIPIGLALTIAGGKMLTTAFTISSGGSGGVFAPSLFIGGMIGAAIGGFAHEVSPQLVPSIAPFVLVGMASFFAGIANTPISALILVSEMTFGYALLVPLMLIAGLAMIFQRGYCLYEKQVKNRLKSPAHFSDFSIDVFSELRVRNALPKRKVVTIEENASAADINEAMRRSSDSFYPVLNQDKKLVGILDVQHFREYLLDPDQGHLFIAKDLMLEPVTIDPEESCQKALSKFLATGYGQIPVVEGDGSGEILGMLSHEDLANAYDREMFRRKSTL